MDEENGVRTGLRKPFRKLPEWAETLGIGGNMDLTAIISQLRMEMALLDEVITSLQNLSPRLRQSVQDLPSRRVKNRRRRRPRVVTARATAE